MEQPHTLLVHGGAHGAWCWDSVLEGLAARGIPASAFDLPGCGADRTPRAALTLHDSIAATVVAVDAITDNPIRLVGHSIAGMLLPAVAAARPHRVVELVYVAAIALHRGQRGIDTIPADRRPSYFDMAAESPDNSLLPDFASARERFFTHLSETEARAAYARLTPQAFGVYLTPAPVGTDDVDVDTRYLALDDDRNFGRAVTDRFAATIGISPTTLPGDHCVMLSDPETLVREL